MFNLQIADPRKCVDFIMTNIQFFQIGEILKLYNIGEIIVGQYENFKTCKAFNEWKLLDFHIRKISELQDRRILDL